MRGFQLLSVALLGALFLGCGAPAAPPPDAPMPSAPDPSGDPAAGEPATADSPPSDTASAPPKRLHLCDRPIDGAGEVWPRIEALSVLPRDELAERCGLPLVTSMSSWRELPVTLLAPIVEHAVKDRPALVKWVAEAPPRAGAQVVALDVARRWKIGEGTAAVDAGIKEWKQALGDGPSKEIQSVLDEADKLGPLLERITEIHKLRCLLEVNALGFAVKCKPIHPQGRQIVLSWRTATRDGLLEQLDLTECKGRSCKKLKKTAAKLLEKYLALVADIDKQLKSEIYQEQLKQWLILPEFRGS